MPHNPRRRDQRTPPPPVVLTDEQEALQLARPYPAELMRAYAVSDRVNDLRNQGRENIEPRGEVQLALAL